MIKLAAGHIDRSVLPKKQTQQKRLQLLDHVICFCFFISYGENPLKKKYILFTSSTRMQLT